MGVDLRFAAHPWASICALTAIRPAAVAVPSPKAVDGTLTATRGCRWHMGVALLE
jgi:hypothetical protein